MNSISLIPLLTLLGVCTVSAYDRCTTYTYCEDGYYCCNGNSRCCVEEEVGGGAVAGIVIGCLIVIVVVIIVIVCCIKNSNRSTRVVNTRPVNTGNVTVISSTTNHPGYGPGYGQGYGGPSYQPYGMQPQPNAPFPQHKAGFDQGPPAYPPPPPPGVY